MTETLNIQGLFPDCVISECCRITDEDYALYPEERALIRKAIAKRQKEFGAGRSCARRCLNRLGITGCVLSKQPDGSIAWPAGIVGSISHSNTWCGATVARREDAVGLGFDIETVARMTRDIAKRVLTSLEMDWVSARHENDARMWFTLMFSAKESIYKCLSPLVGKRIGFHDAQIIPSSEKLCFEARLNKKISSQIPSQSSMCGRYLLHEGDIFTGIFLK
jgi:phosphopantetheine--protein transferase-like protein